MARGRKPKPNTGRTEPVESPRFELSGASPLDWQITRHSVREPKRGLARFLERPSAWGVVIAQGLARDEAEACLDALRAVARRNAQCGARCHALRCTREPGHEGFHRIGVSSWPNAACTVDP